MRALLRLLVAAAALAAPLAALAQQPGNTTALVVSTCGSPSSSFIVGNAGPLTVDTTGKLCTSGGGATLAANTFTGQQTLPAGSVGAPSLAVGAGQTGLYSTGAATLGVSINGTLKLNYGITTAGAWQVNDPFSTNSHAILGGQSFTVNGITGHSMAGSGGVIGWTSTALSNGSSTPDAAFSRAAAGVVALGNGSAGNATGQLRLATLVLGTTLTLASGEIGLAKITASGSAPGAAGLKMAVVCGTNAGSAKIIAYAGSSTTAATVLDNIGSGVTGC